MKTYHILYIFCNLHAVVHNVFTLYVKQYVLVSTIQHSYKVAQRVASEQCHPFTSRLRGDIAFVFVVVSAANAQLFKTHKTLASATLLRHLLPSDSQRRPPPRSPHHRTLESLPVNTTCLRVIVAIVALRIYSAPPPSHISVTSRPALPSVRMHVCVCTFMRPCRHLLTVHLLIIAIVDHIWVKFDCYNNHIEDA